MEKQDLSYKRGFADGRKKEREEFLKLLQLARKHNWTFIQIKHIIDLNTK